MGYGEMSDFIKVSNITKQYSGSQQRILDGISFSVKKEDFLCISGPSGCGKTTLLRCIAGFEDYNGTIQVNGQIVTDPDPSRIMVFQDFNQLFPWRTVKENVCFPLRVNGMKGKKELNSIAEEYLTMVDMWQYRDYYPHQLSGGMKQRVAIARGLVMQPEVILMDEPFASLDGITRRKLHNQLLEIKTKKKLTVLFVTHNIQESLALGTRIMVLDHHGGKIRVDMVNDLERPVSPSTPHYAEYWNILNNALYRNQN